MIDTSDEPPCKKQCLSDNENDHTESLNIASNDEIARYVEVGIEEFLFDGVGFTGKIKERWEDFIVNEVDLNGKVVTLNSLDLPEASNIPNLVVAENKHLSEKVINELNNLLSTSEKGAVEFEASDDKKTRTEIYDFIKSNYPSFCGNTEMRDGKRLFIITNYTDERSQIAKKIAKTNGNDQYCQFVMYKEGKDTIAAVGLIAKYLKIKPGNFTYAGTKDRRGVTTQLVRVRGCAANRLKGLNKCLRGIVLGDFSYVASPLKLGDLYGNRFRLVIRDVQTTDDNIAVAMDRFKRGFINYYGMQRFGSTKIRSHEIGKLAIASEWQAMIKMILEPTDEDLPFMRDCKTKFKECGDCEEFLRNASHGIEKSIVSGISKHGFTLNALDQLPRNLRQLYVHSYQSYVWNKIVSKRIRECGWDTVLEGDLVEHGDSVSPIRDGQLAQHTVADVVLPLPGYDVSLPMNQVADWYHDLLSNDNLTMEKLRHRVKDFSLPGSYRRMIVVPTDLIYSIHQYHDVTAPLIESDHRRINKSFNLPPSEGPLKAVVVEFTLPKSAYATIAIRELMKDVKVIQ